MQSWHIRIKRSVRKKSTEDLRQAIWSLQRIPGFSEVRSQVKSLRSLLYKEWKRSKKESNEMPPLSPIIPYIRSTDTESIPLAKVVLRIAQGRKPFPRRQAHISLMETLETPINEQLETSLKTGETLCT